MVMQAFIDDSYNQDGVFILAGYMATAETWVKFSLDWEELLPFALLGKSGKRRFKMREMVGNPDRAVNVPAFYHVIKKHSLLSISCKIDIGDLRRAIARISVVNWKLDWGPFGNPYLMAFRCLIDMFHSRRQEISALIPLNEKVDFYFDEQRESGVIHAAWRDFIERRPDEIRSRFGAEPKFENDEDFMPLQAADFWAWWVRKWWAEGSPEKIESPVFDGLNINDVADHAGVMISFTEDQLVDALVGLIRSQLGPEAIILVSGRA